MKSLVMSGGAMKGAWECSVVKYLTQEAGRSYDSVHGISVGAINAAFMASYPKEQDAASIDTLYNFWYNLNKSQVYKRWFPFGRLHSLWKNSLYNSQPLIDLLHQHLDINQIRKSGKLVTVSAVSLSTGKYRTFTQNDDCFVDGVLASSSFPCALRPILIEDNLYVDAGLKHIIPLKEAINAGATEIDVIICSPIMTTESYNNKANTLDMGMRCMDLMTDQIMQDDLDELIGKYPEITIKIIRPVKNLISSSSLTFDQSEIRSMLQQGYLDAKQQYK